MNKFISKFSVSSDIIKGNSKQLVICPNCSHKQIIKNKNKLRYSKIKSYRCLNCSHIFNIGNIYNFKTGTKLNNRLNNHNQERYDEYIWNNNYDNV